MLLTNILILIRAFKASLHQIFTLKHHPLPRPLSLSTNHLVENQFLIHQNHLIGLRKPTISKCTFS